MGLLDYDTSDGRFLFMLPWQKHTLIGTTDSVSPAHTLPGPPSDEVDWLLNECKTYLSPDLEVRRSDVMSAWQGWRPLAADPHAPPDAPVSRDHIISENTETGIIFIAGGKWSKFSLSCFLACFLSSHLTRLIRSLLSTIRSHLESHVGAGCW